MVKGLGELENTILANFYKLGVNPHVKKGLASAEHLKFQ